jgi:hypothetical protein
MIPDPGGVPSQIAGPGAVGVEEAVEEGHGGTGADGGAGAEGGFPAGLEGGGQLVAHPGGGVGVDAADAGDLVAEALLGEDLGDWVIPRRRTI